MHAGASRSNNMRDPSYGLLRSSLELMLTINMTDTMQYGFMLSRVYLQLNINHEVINESRLGSVHYCDAGGDEHAAGVQRCPRDQRPGGLPHEQLPGWP